MLTKRLFTRFLPIFCGALFVGAPSAGAQQADPPGVQTIGEPSSVTSIDDGNEQPADFRTEDLAPRQDQTQVPSAPGAASAPEPPSATIGGSGAGEMGGPSAEAPVVDGAGTPLRAGAPVASGDPPGRIGRLALIEGGVSIKAAEQTQWLVALKNRPLTRGDSLYVAPKGRAELNIGSVHVRLADGALLFVRALSDDTLQLEVHSGSVGVHVPELAQQEVIELDVPGAAMALQAAGDYRIDVNAASERDKRGRTRIIVRKGQAEIRVGEGTQKLRSGEMLVQAPDATKPGKIALAAAIDSFDGFCAERERILKNKPALKYVSSQTAGYEDLDEYGTWSNTSTYGALWRPRVVPSGWAPFAYGRWVWVAPWGWTWIDDMSWGFAPFHYGRWVYFNSAWMWAPGPMARQPFYLPHLVTFFGAGGAGFGMGVGLGAGAVGWYPLGWGEPFYPGFGCSYAYLHAINRPYGNITGFAGQRIPLMNRGAPNSITAVSAQAMQSAQSIAPMRHTLPPAALAQARVGLASPPVHPVPASFGYSQAAAVHLPPPHLMHPSLLPSFRATNGPLPTVPGTLGNQSQVFQVGRPGYTGTMYPSPVVTRINTPPLRQVQPMMPMMPMYRPYGQYYGGFGHGPYEHFGHDVHPSVGNPGFYGHYGPNYGGGGFYYGHPGGAGGGFFHEGHHGR